MSTKSMFEVLQRPHVPEKSTFQREDDNQIVMRVRPDANKSKFARLSRSRRKVTAVNTMNYRGKTKVRVATRDAAPIGKSGRNLDMAKRSSSSM